MKHAYLILAHNEWRLLQTLIDCIDDERNDIYVHIDAKVKELPELKAQHSGLFVLKERADVRWAGFSMIEAEYLLFENAFLNRPYSYYHLLSGVDLPLKSQSEIHVFFTDNAGKEFIGYSLTEMTPMLVERMQRYHICSKHFRDPSGFRRFLA